MSEELAFLSQLKDEPAAIILFAIIVGIKFMELFIKHIIPFFVSLITHKKKKTVEQILEGDSRERIKRQAEVDKRLDDLGTKVNEIYSILEDHEESFDSLSRHTLENMLFNENAPVFRRLKAFLRLIAMKANGRVKNKGFEVILEHKDIWLDVLETQIKLNLKIVDQEYFSAILDEINRRIFDGMMR